MKHKIFQLFLICGCVAISLACKKEAGSGGTSSIVGTITGTNYDGVNIDPAEKEITHITIPDGADIADAEYVLLNTPNGGNQYYIWFDWVGGVDPDPGLVGRTGIPVSYDFTETNVEVASNALTAIQAAVGSDFSVSLNNDILILTNLEAGEVTDAEELSSYITVDVANQGSDAITTGVAGVQGPMVEERVYLIYGDDDFYSESVRTDEEGRYQFRDLNRGYYRVVVYTADVNDPYAPLQKVETTVTISNKKEIVEAETLDIIKF